MTMSEIHNRIDRSLIPAYVPDGVVDDFRNHMYYCFKYLGIPGGEPTPHQYAIGDALQSFCNDMQLHAGRGAGKSTITAMLVSWFLLLDPNCNIMILSAGSDKAIRFMSEVRKILTHVPYCNHLLPNANELDNATAFNVGCMTIHGRQDPSCFAKGITSQITGSHAFYVIVDDVEIEGNCETQAQRDKLLHKLTELEQIRNEGGRIIFLGTPQTIESIYFKLAEHYALIKFPAIMPDKTIPDETQNVAQWILDLDLDPEEPTHPERFNKEALERRLARSGQTQFDLHYKLSTGLSDRYKYPLKLRDLIVMDVSPEVFPERVIWSSAKTDADITSFGTRGDYICKPQFISDHFVKYQDRCLFVDPSGEGEDETALVVASFVNGYVIIHDITGMQSGYDDSVMKKICDLCRKYNVRKIRVEDNYGGGMFRRIMTPIVSRQIGSCDIDGFPVRGQKEDRICNALEPTMNLHRLVFDRDAIAPKETQIQITRMQRKRGAVKHDDRVDCLANAVKFWTEDMIQSDEIVEARREDKELKQAILDFRYSGRGWNDLRPENKGCYIVTFNPSDPKERKPTIKDLRRTKFNFRR
jgi:hypothetical protein